jgi:hypothetical protein
LEGDLKLKIEYDFWYSCFEKGFGLTMNINGGILGFNPNEVFFKKDGRYRGEKIKRGDCKSCFIDAIDFVLKEE